MKIQTNKKTSCVNRAVAPSVNKLNKTWIFTLMLQCKDSDDFYILSC